MAYVGSINNVVTLGAADWLYALKTALTTAGWDVLATSDGTNYRYNGGNPMVPGPNPTDDNLITPANWNNNSAWCRLREPGGAYNAITNPLSGREYVFMRGNGVNATSVVIKYSRATGFVVAAPVNPQTTLPTTGVGGDGVVWLASSLTGFGNESSVTTATSALNWALSSGYVSCVASNTSVNGVYGWWLMRVAPGAAQNSIYLTYTEAAQNSPSTYPSQDIDPSYRQYAGAIDFWSNSPGSPYLPQFWNCYDFTAPVNAYRSYVMTGNYGMVVTVNAVVNANTLVYPRAGIGYGPYGATVNQYPLLVGSTFTYPKGMTTGIKGFNVIASLMDTLNLTGSEPRIIVYVGTGNFSMPWVPNQLPLF